MTPNNLKISDAGIALIKQYEGLRLAAYPDPGSKGEPYTIGYGHTSASGAPKVWPNMVITKDEAETILRLDLLKFEVAVNNAVTTPITQNQFDALVSFAYNCGVGNLQTSTLLKRVNARKFDEAATEFSKWTRSCGRVMPGLLKRRRAEADLFAGHNAKDFGQTGISPDRPVASKAISSSKQAGGAVAAGGLAAISAASDAARQMSDAGSSINGLIDAAKNTNFLAMIAICAIAGAIWYWRRQHLLEEAA